MARTLILTNVAGAVLVIDLNVFDELPAVIGQFLGDPYLLKVTYGWRLHAGFLSRRYGILPAVNGLLDLSLCGEGRLVGQLRVTARCMDAVRLLVKDGPLRERMEHVLPRWESAVEPLFAVILEEDLGRQMKEMYLLGQSVLDLAILNFMPDDPTTDGTQDLVSRALAKMVRVVWKENWEMYSTTDMGRTLQGDVWERTDLRILFQNSRSFVEPAKTLYYDNYRALLREYQVVKPGNPLIWLIPPIHLPLSPSQKFPTVSRMMADDMALEPAWMPEGLDQEGRVEALRSLLAQRQRVLGRVDVEWRLAIVPGYEDTIECYEEVAIEDLWWLRYQYEEGLGISREIQRERLDMDAVRRRLRQIRRLREVPGAMLAAPQPEVDWVLPRPTVDRPGSSQGRGNLVGDPRGPAVAGPSGGAAAGAVGPETIPKPERVVPLARPVTTSESSGAGSEVRATPAASGEREWPVGPSGGATMGDRLTETRFRMGPSETKPPKPVRVKASSVSSASSRSSGRGPTSFWKDVGMEAGGGTRYGWGRAPPLPVGISSNGRRQALHRWHPTGIQEERRRDVIRRLFRQFLRTYDDRPERLTADTCQRRDFLFAVMLAQFPFLEVLPETWAYEPVVVGPEMLDKQVLPFALPSAGGPLNWWADQNQQFRDRGSRCVDQREADDRDKWAAQSRLRPGEFFKVIMTQALVYASTYDQEAKKRARDGTKSAASQGQTLRAKAAEAPVESPKAKGVAVGPAPGKPVIGRGRAKRPTAVDSTPRPGGALVVFKEQAGAPVVVQISETVRRRQEHERDEQRAEESRWSGVRRGVAQNRERQGIVEACVASHRSWWAEVADEPSQIRINVDLGDCSQYQIRATTSGSVIRQGTQVLGRAQQHVIQHIELAPGVEWTDLDLGLSGPGPLAALGPVERPMGGVSAGMAKEIDRMLDVWDSVSPFRTPQGPRSPSPESPVMSD